jgi:hypothetical protein
MMTRLASSVSTSAAGLSASLPFVQHGPVRAPSPHEAVLAAHTPPSAQPAKTAAASHGGGPSTRRNGSAPAGKSSPGQGSAADPTPTPTPKDNAQPTDPSSNGKKAANPSASVQPSPDPSATPH